MQNTSLMKPLSIDGPQFCTGQFPYQVSYTTVYSINFDNPSESDRLLSTKATLTTLTCTMQVTVNAWLTMGGKMAFSTCLIFLSSLSSVFLQYFVFMEFA